MIDEFQRALENHHVEIAELQEVVRNLDARVGVYERLIGQCMYAALRDMPNNHELFDSFQMSQAKIHAAIDNPSAQDELSYEVISRIFSFVGRSLIENGFMTSDRES